MREYLTEEHKLITQKARDTYGENNQILVSIEELNELACVLAKYPRYDNPIKAKLEMFDKALDEVADVYIVLDHIKKICCLSDGAIMNRVDQKMARMERWLLHSDSQQETMEDRAVEEPLPQPDPETAEPTSCCLNCRRLRNFNEKTWMNFCSPCYQAQSTDGTIPYFLPLECKEKFSKALKKLDDDIKSIRLP